MKLLHCPFMIHVESSLLIDFPVLLQAFVSKINAHFCREAVAFFESAMTAPKTFSAELINASDLL